MNKEKKTIVKVKDFNLNHIFDCGQCFRWDKEEDGSYTGVVFNKILNISFKPDRENSINGEIQLIGSDEEDFKNIWQEYLDLNTDYSIIKGWLKKDDEIMAEAIQWGQGIRILNQELWEVIISFIVSQNNNIKRIKGCIEKLCELYGEPLGEFKGKKRYGFPTVETLARLDVEDLGQVKLGYRAKYIINTSKAIDSLQKEKGIKINELSTMETDSLRELLLQYNGIGLKVANCILLFGASKKESFPIDVWVKRVMNKLYGISEKNLQEMETFATEHFGEYGGIAQQYLFYYMREIS